MLWNLVDHGERTIEGIPLCFDLDLLIPKTVAIILVWYDSFGELWQDLLKDLTN